MNRKGLKILFSIILFIILGYLLTITNLIVDEDPLVSDVIIVAEGGQEERPRKAAELYKKGYSKSNKVIVSPIVGDRKDDYLSYGVLNQDIINEPTATSTYTNATATLAMMEDYGFTSAIVISSDYHMLRTMYIYDRVNQDYGYELTFVAAFHEQDGQEVPWYRYEPYSIVAGYKEVYKLLGYIFGLYHFIDLD